MLTVLRINKPKDNFRVKETTSRHKMQISIKPLFNNKCRKHHVNNIRVENYENQKRYQTKSLIFQKLNIDNKLEEIVSPFTIDKMFEISVLFSNKMQL